jgi:hypothetical protein
MAWFLLFSPIVPVDPLFTHLPSMGILGSPHSHGPIRKRADRTGGMAFRSYRASSTSFRVLRSFLSWRSAARFWSGSNTLSKPPDLTSTARIKRVPPGTS